MDTGHGLTMEWLDERMRALRDSEPADLAEEAVRCSAMWQLWCLRVNVLRQRQEHDLKAQLDELAEAVRRLQGEAL